MLRYDPSISNCNHLALAPACNLPSPTATPSTTAPTTSKYPPSTQAASTSQTVSSPNPTVAFTTSQMPSSTPTISPAIPTTAPPSFLPAPMPGKPISSPEDHGQSTEHFGEGEDAGVSETSAEESGAGASDGDVGEGVDKVEEGAEGGEGSSVDGSQGGEDIQEEEDSQEESIPEGQGGTGPNGQENDLAEGSIPSGDNTEELGGPGEEGENEEGSNYLVAAGSAYPCPSPGYFSLTGSCREFWVCKEVGRYKIVEIHTQPMFQTNI